MRPELEYSSTGMARDGLAQGRESRMPHIIHLPIEIAVTTIPQLTTTFVQNGAETGVLSAIGCGPRNTEKSF